MCSIVFIILYSIVLHIEY